MEQNFPDINFIKGWVRTSLIDYPGKIATVIYTGGCNLRCPFCHNPALIEFPEQNDSIPLNEIVDFLQLRTGIIDGIVISGGEPLIHPKLISLLQLFRTFDIHIKLDTNGCFPGRLQEVIHLGLVDMVAMDIKASKDHYGTAVGNLKGVAEKVDESLTILKSSGIPFELRTTVIPNLHTRDEIKAIAKWIAPVEHFYLQQFRPEVTLDDSYHHLLPLSHSELIELQLLCCKTIPHTAIRGLST